MAEPARRRLRAEERRELLLDAAVAVLEEMGVGAVTMEAIAARAGVNKALPYRHFDNARAVLVELYVRFNRDLATRVAGAVAEHDHLEARVQAAVSAFFDVARDNSGVLTLLNGAPDAGGIAADANARSGAEQYVVELMTATFGVPRRDAMAVAEIAVGTLASAVRAWGQRFGSRRSLEAIATAALVGIVQASRERTGSGR